MPEDVMAESGADSDATKAKWSALETLVALLIDELRQQTWVYMQANSAEKIARPTPIPRPGLPRRALRAIPLANARKLDPRLSAVPDDLVQERMDELTGRRGKSR
jgi:hypothetical protein